MAKSKKQLSDRCIYYDLAAVLLVPIYVMRLFA